MYDLFGEMHFFVKELNCYFVGKSTIEMNFFIISSLFVPRPIHVLRYKVWKLSTVVDLGPILQIMIHVVTVRHYNINR